MQFQTLKNSTLNNGINLPKSIDSDDSEFFALSKETQELAYEVLSQSKVILLPMPVIKNILIQNDDLGSSLREGEELGNVVNVILEHFFNV